MTVMDFAPVAAPERSLEQRMDALRKANRIRFHRAQLKRDVEAGRVSVADVLRAPAEEVLTMHVLDLLLAMPKVGRVKANKVLMRARISPSKTIGGMSPRQRGEIIGLLAGLPSGRGGTIRR